MRQKITQFVQAEDGATAIEYTLIASCICLAIVVVVMTIGTNLKGTYQAVANAFSPH